MLGRRGRQAVTRKAHELSRAQLATVLAAYADMDHHPGPELLATLSSRVRAAGALGDLKGHLKGGVRI